MYLKVFHRCVINGSCQRSNNGIIGNIETIENKLLEVGFLHRMARGSEAVSELFGTLEVINHGKISFSHGLEITTDLHMPGMRTRGILCLKSQPDFSSGGEHNNLG